MRTAFALILFTSLLPDRIFSQVYDFRHFGVEDGLGQSTVNCIFEDSRGYMWFGTQDGGVTRFDGVEMKNFTTKDGMASNDITCIAEDMNGNLWFGATAGGIAVYDGKKIFSVDGNRLQNTIVYSISFDKDNIGWVATCDGLYTIKNNQIGKYSSGSMPWDSVCLFSVMPDRNNNLWIATRLKGVHILNHPLAFDFKECTNLKDEVIWTIKEDKNGVVWIASYDNGIYRSDRFSVKQVPALNALKGKVIFGIDFDIYGNLWIATDGNGVYKYDGNNLVNYTVENGLSTNNIYSIKADRSGDIWIGTGGNGLDKLQSERFVTYNENYGISSREIQSIYVDGNKIWMGFVGGGGVNILESDKIQKIQLIVPNEDLQANCFFRDSKGNMWIGSENNGLLGIMANGQKKRFDKIFENADAHSRVNDITEDKNGNIWICNDPNGLAYYDGKNMLIEDALKQKYTVSLFCDKQGVVWCGNITYEGKGGVYNNKQGSFQPVLNQELGNKTIWDIYQDSKGNMLFGTAENGLYMLSGNSLLNFDNSSGLSSNIVYNIVEDKDGYLWTSSQNGIDRLKIEHGKLISVKHYGKEDGLAGQEININCMALLGNGKDIVLGSQKGLVKYSAKYDFPGKVAPVIHLTGIRLNYEKIDWSKRGYHTDTWSDLPLNPEFSYSDNHLTFEFIGINHNSPSQVSYRFRLLGSEDKFSPPVKDRKVTYSGLDPGTYTFELLALNENNIASSNPVKYSFTILPPFYMTGWFYLICFVTFAGLLAVFIKYRERNLKRDKELLEQKVSERTQQLDDAFQNIRYQKTEIEKSISYAKRIQEAILPETELLSNEFPESFILYLPRDVVSGDFYWFNKSKGNLLCAVADCTGHGVPGAFMSMIGSSTLNQILEVTLIDKPSYILDELHNSISKSLKQSTPGSDSKDGMDIALARISKSKMKLDYSGANRPIIIIRNGQLFELKPDKMPIGGHTREKTFNYNHQSFALEKGDTIYLFTDGYADQFGGANNRKFMSKRLKETLVNISSQSMYAQKELLLESFLEWKGSNEQVDDVLMMGIKVS